MTTLAVVVPATNAPPTLARCVEAIAASADPPEEVHVVTTAALPGPAAARNEGVARTAAEVVVFVDADVLVHPDALGRIRSAFDDAPGTAAVFGSYDDAPPSASAVSAFRNLLHHHVHHEGRGPATTFWAGLGAVRRDAFLALGGFDAARYPRPSIEDIELGTRLAAAGLRIELRPEIQGTHLKEWSLAEVLRTDFARRGIPWAELLLEGRADTGALNLGWRHRLSAAASLAGTTALAARRPAPALASLAVLVALNASFYELLARRRGRAQAVAGIGFHVLHHLTGAAAAAVAVGRHALR